MPSQNQIFQTKAPNDKRDTILVSPGPKGRTLDCLFDFGSAHIRRRHFYTDSDPNFALYSVIPYNNVVILSFYRTLIRIRLYSKRNLIEIETFN